MAGAAKADRNRAIDLYRAVAMIAVAVGHWMAMHVALGADGALEAGNALELEPRMAVFTWLLQVMPLFFVVGGFSSAMSLDAFNNAATHPMSARPQDWIIARLRRMLAPTIALAATWAILIAGGFAIGQGSMIATGATAAAIPLWFLANYTIDTALAPYVLPRFRKHPVALPAIGGAVFCAVELARFADVAYLPQLNWVLGWLLFQIAGFAWRDGLLPTGKKMAALAVGFWVAAITAVSVGPWPVSMVHFPGLENSPTHPPSLALMLFGAAYSCTAIAVAPAVSNWLAARPKAWAGVVAANTVAMSVYLWHLTAAVVASAVFYLAGWLPTASVGTGAWWLQKLPLIGLSLVVLGAIVAKVMRIEQDALLAPRAPWIGGPWSLMAVVAILSTALKQWAHGEFTVAAVCIAIVLVLWHTVMKSDSLVASR